MGFAPYSGLGLLSAAVRHKTFVSYYHKADQAYRDAFEKVFGHLFIGKSVQPGDISTDVSADYIKRLILEGESPRELRRLHYLREWSHDEQIKQIFP